jgi:hypothetical protein
MFRMQFVKEEETLVFGEDLGCTPVIEVDRR